MWPDREGGGGIINLEKHIATKDLLGPGALELR